MSTLPPEEDTTPVIDLSRINETGEALDARMAVVVTARNELGQQDPDKYWSVVCPALMGNPHTVAWCGGFALWCLRQVFAQCDGWQWVIGKGFLYRLPTTLAPLTGDIAYFGHNQHHAIVELVADGLLHSIDGNGLRYPREGVVGATHRASDVSAYYSIAPLIGESP